MRHPLLRSLRVAPRLLWLASELALAVILFAVLVLPRRRAPGHTAQARWLQRLCDRVLLVLGLELQVSGPIPSRGLLVCNHLSYLDIVVLGATAPCVFVAKAEVRQWPVFGWLASLGGTLFLCREKRSDVARMNGEIGRVLGSGSLVVLFPEGTTSDGRELLPFKSSLLEPATAHPHGLSAGFIEYSLEDGSVADEVCYWRDMTLLPHLLNLLGKRRIEARLSFARLRGSSTDRKQLARELHSEVLRLKGDLSFSTIS